MKMKEERGKRIGIKKEKKNKGDIRKTELW
jgi:hypothetical protein